MCYMMLQNRSLRSSMLHCMMELQQVSWMPADSLPRKVGVKRTSGHLKRSFPMVMKSPLGSSQLLSMLELKKAAPISCSKSSARQHSFSLMSHTTTWSFVVFRQQPRSVNILTRQLVTSCPVRSRRRLYFGGCILRRWAQCERHHHHSPTQHRWFVTFSSHILTSRKSTLEAYKKFVHEIRRGRNFTFFLVTIIFNKNTSGCSWSSRRLGRCCEGRQTRKCLVRFGNDSSEPLSAKIIIVPFPGNLQNENDRTIMGGHRRVAYVEDFYGILKQAITKTACMQVKEDLQSSKFSHSYLIRKCSCYIPPLQLQAYL